MNSFTINSVALNDEDSLTSIVYLPSANCSLVWVMDEWLSAEITGSMSLGLEMTGDISKVISLGTGTATITFDVSGELTQNKQIYFDAVNIEILIDTTGTLSTVTLGSYAESIITFEPTGDISLIGLLTGSIDSTYNIEGVLSKQISMGVSTVDMSVDATGTLQLTGGLFSEDTIAWTMTGSMLQGFSKYLGSASSSIIFGPTGNLQLTGGLVGIAPITLSNTGSLTKNSVNTLPGAMTTLSIANTGTLTGVISLKGETVSSWLTEGGLSKKVYLSGEVPFNLYLTGSLANNAYGMDLDNLLMYRPKLQREMTR